MRLMKGTSLSFLVDTTTKIEQVHTPELFRRYAPQKSGDAGVRWQKEGLEGRLIISCSLQYFYFAE